MLEFSLLGFEKFAPRRGIEEQVAYFHRRAYRVGRRLHPRGHIATLGLYLPSLLGLGGARSER